MKKTYVTPCAKQISLETEEILSISFGGFDLVLKDSSENPSSQNPAKDFGNISLF